VHDMRNTARLVGVCSLVGGAAWTAACFVHNSLPQGCIDAECDGHAMRGSSPVATALFVVAGLMLAGAGVGLLLLARERNGGLGRAAVAAGVCGALGLLLLGSAAVVSAVDNDWNGMPGLVVPGVLLLAAGLVLLAVAVIRARVVPVWCSALLLASALVLPFANEQTSRILLAVPFGVCWALLGVVVLRRPAAVQREAHAGAGTM